jgi:hypothetical protein
MIFRFFGRISSTAPSCTSFDPTQVLFRGIQGYAQFAGYFLVGTIEFVQIDDSTYICHRFHLGAHLSAYLVRGGFPSWGGQKRIGFSLYRGVKIRSANTMVLFSDPADNVAALNIRARVAVNLPIVARFFAQPRAPVFRPG